ncbi:MAG: hypothetical protein JXR94_20555 [Candidatus Hydrogenedentes bacterium]|nr:hypothetical protein [Candidatus Hydrogenedentota bacterium]
MATGQPQEVTPAKIWLAAAAVQANTVVYIVAWALLTHTGAIPEEGLSPMEPDVANLLGIVLLVLGIAFVAASLVARSVMLARRPPGVDPLAHYLRTMLVSMALGTTPSIFGLVYALMTGTVQIPLILWGCGLASGILLFPSRSLLESLVASRESAAALRDAAGGPKELR